MASLKFLRVKKDANGQFTFPLPLTAFILSVREIDVGNEYELIVWER